MQRDGGGGCEQHRKILPPNQPGKSDRLPGNKGISKGIRVMVDVTMRDGCKWTP